MRWLHSDWSMGFSVPTFVPWLIRFWWNVLKMFIIWMWYSAHNKLAYCNLIGWLFSSLKRSSDFDEMLMMFIIMLMMFIIWMRSQSSNVMIFRTYFTYCNMIGWQFPCNNFWQSLDFDEDVYHMNASLKFDWQDILCINISILRSDSLMILMKFSEDAYHMIVPLIFECHDIPPILY